MSNFAYPYITNQDNFSKIVNALNENKIEIRPLVCESISEQPFWKKTSDNIKMNFAKVVHNQGMYLPNNFQIKEDEIKLICDIVNTHNK